MKSISRLLVEGIDNASKKVQTFSNNRITIQAEKARIIPLSEIGMLFGDDEIEVNGVVMNVMERPPIQYVMVMTEDARVKIVATIFGEAGIKNVSMADSILQELGNILGSAIANNLADYLQSSVRTSVPEVISDLAGAIFTSIISARECVNDEIILIDISLNVDHTPVECTIFLLFDDDLSEKILTENNE